MRISDSTSPYCYWIGPSLRVPQEQFNVDISHYTGGSLPMPSNQKIDCKGVQYTGALYMHYPVTAVNLNEYAAIDLILKGDVGCPSIGGARMSQERYEGDGTACKYALPSISSL